MNTTDNIIPEADALTEAQQEVMDKFKDADQAGSELDNALEFLERVLEKKGF